MQPAVPFQIHFLVPSVKGGYHKSQAAWLVSLLLSVHYLIAQLLVVKASDILLHGPSLPTNF